MMKRISMLAALLVAGPAVVPAQAQTFPAKLVRITSPYPTGISPDIAARLIADKLSRYWNQQVLVEARPGANGFIAFNAVKKAPPDGHDLLLVGDSHLTINPYLFKALPYDPESDFAPVGIIYRAPFFIWVAGDSPYKSVGDLVAAARKDPNRVAYSTPYVGSPPHLGGALLAQLSGTSMLAVQFKESAQLFTSVINGDIAFNISSLGSGVALLKAGRIRALATTSTRRTPELPDVPTVQEAGGPGGYDLETWVGLLAPRGTPAEVTGRISADVNRAQQEQDVRDRYRAMGLQTLTGTASDMGNAVRTGLRKNADVVKRMGIQPE
jgi:tripartite-type tricarboxylate transporter receptor subunit TctC